MIIYVNRKENRIEAILKRPDSKNPFQEYCEEIILPDDFDLNVDYTNENGEVRHREMTAEELDEAISYREKRYSEYPSITDQLDMIWHSINNGTLDQNSQFFTMIQSIKQKYPKE